MTGLVPLRSLALVLCGLSLVQGDVSADQIGRRSDPLPQGQRLVAQDGDTVVVENDARVNVVRRREALVRLVFDATRGHALILADFVSGPSLSADGLVDLTWQFGIQGGTWPLEPRWEGMVTLEETLPSVIGPRGGLVIETPQGVIEFVSAGMPLVRGERAGSLAVMRYNSATTGAPGRGMSFDDAERQPLATPGSSSSEAVWRAATEAQVATGGVGFSSDVVPPQSAPQGAVRVGGNIRPPTKIYDVRPIMPEAAKTARVQGVVVLEVVINVDGAVENTRVVRSIPLLDEAALDAVRQWRFTPTLMNGQAVPVIMTVTVQFSLN